MAEINLIFEMKDKKSINGIAQSLQQRIGEMEIVEEVEAVADTPERTRALSGAEIVAAIGVTILVIRSGRELLEEVRMLIEEIKRLRPAIDGLKDVYMDIGKRRVQIDNLKPKDFEEVAGKI